MPKLLEFQKGEVFSDLYSTFCSTLRSPSLFNFVIYRDITLLLILHYCYTPFFWRLTTDSNTNVIK